LGSPYKELNSTLVFGLLAHSHTWKGPASDPLGNIEKALFAADQEYVQHPIECLDFLTVSDLATWSVVKNAYMNPNNWLQELRAGLAEQFGPNGSAFTVRFCMATTQGNQVAYFSPIGALLMDLYSKLAWEFPDMRHLETYFREVGIS